MNAENSERTCVRDQEFAPQITLKSAHVVEAEGSDRLIYGDDQAEIGDH